MIALANRSAQLNALDQFGNTWKMIKFLLSIYECYILWHSFGLVGEFHISINCSKVLKLFEIVGMYKPIAHRFLYIYKRELIK